MLCSPQEDFIKYQHQRYIFLAGGRSIFNKKRGESRYKQNITIKHPGLKSIAIVNPLNKKNLSADLFNNEKNDEPFLGPWKTSST